MSKNIIRIAQSFLNEVTMKGGFELVSSLIEELENKPDPDPAEINMINSLQEFITQLESVKSNLKNYVRNFSEVNEHGNKLHSLYENLSYDGNSGYLKK